MPPKGSSDSDSKEPLPVDAIVAFSALSVAAHGGLCIHLPVPVERRITLQYLLPANCIVLTPLLRCPYPRGDLRGDHRRGAGIQRGETNTLPRPSDQRLGGDSHALPL